jgi:antitoxin component YwqK of YwqJK toxin-antitoxin module
MEVVSMAHQVQYLIKYVVLLSFIGCVNSSSNEINYKLVSSTDTSLHLKDGLLLYGNNLFSGTIYALYINTTDTAEIKNYLLGKENGVWKKYFPNHEIKEIREFNDGKKVGKMIGFWGNKKPMLEYHFKEDEFDGTCKEWNYYGQLIREMNYIKGHEEGAQKMYYDNGKIRSNYIMKEGKRFGLLGTKNCVNVSDSIFKK